MGQNHRRIIAITLTLLDEALCEFQGWARGREVHSVLYHERNRLSAVQCCQVENLVQEMRTILAEMQNALGLDTRIKDASDAIRGACFGLWESLVELEGKYLSAYGAPSESLVAFVEPRAKQLIAHLNAVVDNLRESGAA